ncbi:MAG TPA: hypothetical protein VE999_03595 [Gemmataceae bacterium]|nr:hypothetical protein [Gemmataceae bacterium]
MADLAEYRQENPKTEVEKTDWPLVPIGLIALAVLLLLAITPFVLIAAFPRALPDVDKSLRISPPGPRLQTDTSADLKRFRAEEERRLNSYYWVDKEKGIVHIPIEQAMKNLAKAGIAGFPKASP